MPTRDETFNLDAKRSASAFLYEQISQVFENSEPFIGDL
jgi:hypothetical protein